VREPLTRAPLTVAVAQPPCVPFDVAVNAATHAATIRAAGARVVAFPELSLTGYDLHAPTIELDDPRLGPIVEACRETGSIALVGAPAAGAGGTAHIAMLAIDGKGAKVAYRKVWVADEESRRFAAGPAPAVIDVDGWRLGLAICRDTGIARHVVDTAALGIDAYVAGTLMFAWETDVQDERGRGIATERGIWVAFASFAGPTGEGYDRTAGSSSIWAPGGAVVARAGPAAGEVARAIIG
jgi:predicted amidohydrolase